MRFVKIAGVISCLSFLLVCDQATLKLSKKLFTLNRSSQKGNNYLEAIVYLNATAEEVIVPNSTSQLVEEQQTSTSINSPTDQNFCALTSETEAQQAIASQTVISQYYQDLQAQADSKLLAKMQSLLNWSGDSQLQANTTHPSLAIVESYNTRSKSPDSAQNTNLDEQEVTNQEVWQIWLQKNLIAQLPSKKQAQHLAKNILALSSQPNFDPEQIQPAFVENQPAAKVKNQVLFIVQDQSSITTELNSELLAIKWINNLRLAFNARPLDLVEAQTQLHSLQDSKQTIQGSASWYGPYFHGRLTANGEVYNQHGFTAAHPSLPLGTFLKVTNLDTQKSMIVRVNDRGPYIPPRSLDLSLGSARCVEAVEAGVLAYRAVIMQSTEEN